MEKGGIRNWLLNTFAVNNLINESHHLKRRILFEEIPSGKRYLTPIIEAMRDSLEIELIHQSYWYSQPSVYTLQPYCVKVFRQRWYVIGFARNATLCALFLRPHTPADHVGHLLHLSQRFQSGRLFH